MFYALFEKQHRLACCLLARLAAAAPVRLIYTSSPRPWQGRQWNARPNGVDTSLDPTPVRLFAGAEVHPENCSPTIIIDPLKAELRQDLKIFINSQDIKRAGTRYSRVSSIWTISRAAGAR